MERQLLARERQDLIADRLRADGRVAADRLAVTFGVSADTIRRDLREMAAAGLCDRVYGGALARKAADRPFGERTQRAAGRKAALARAAIGLIEPETTVFFDAGSTNLAVARALPDAMRLTAITNAPAIAVALMDRPNIETVLVGGRLDPVVGGAVDGHAVGECATFAADLCLLGACGLDWQAGVTATRYEDATFKRAVASRSRRIVVAATTDKIGTQGAFPVVVLAQCYGIVLEHDASDETVASIEAAGPHVIRTKAED